MTIPTPAELEKSYPPKGPLRLFRFVHATSFPCVRCGMAKKAKLVGICNGDWNRRICNGCYGTLLSIYDLKTAGRLEEDAADELAELLLSFVGKGQTLQLVHRYKLAQSRASVLHERSVRFLATAEHVAATLGSNVSLDWSPAVIGLCKTVELEAVERLLAPLRTKAQSGQFDQDLQNRDLAKVARYCSNPSSKPPELGSLAHFLKIVANEPVLRTTSPLVRAFLRQMTDWTFAGWLIEDDGLHRQLAALAKTFRNRAAHTEELSEKDYAACRSAVIGAAGVLWRLVQATTSRPKLGRIA